jgi:hypothetical protein
MALQFASVLSEGKSKISVFDLVINSEDRENYLGTTSTVFTVNLQNPINQKIVGYGLKSAIIPKTNYNIPAIRNTFTFNNSISTSTITITPGNYTMTELLAEIQTQLNALGFDTYTVTYNSISGKVTFQSTLAAFTINPTLSTQQGSILYKLGFVPGIAYTGGTVTAPNVADISGIKSAFIKIKQLTQYMRNTTNSMLNFKVDLSCQFGSIVYFADEGRYHQYFNVSTVNLSNIGYLEVSLVDEYGVPLELNGRDWSFVLQFVTIDR